MVGFSRTDTGRMAPRTTTAMESRSVASTPLSTMISPGGEFYRHELDQRIIEDERGGRCQCREDTAQIIGHGGPPLPAGTHARKYRDRQQ